MKTLVLGGTAWLGREITLAALSSGHDVTCLARGTDVADGARLVQADRDRDDALAGVASERWDAVIDVARQPGHVRRAARDLRDATAHFVFVSTGNVYASQAEIGADESAELLPPLESDRFEAPDDYGPAKVACEAAVLDAFGVERSLIARAGLIGGPGDPSGRTTYWPWRFAHPAVEGAVLVPDSPELPVGVIDVRDLAEWLVRCAEHKTSGTVNAMGVPMPLPDHMRAARAAAGSDAAPVAAAVPWLQEKGVAEWSGPRSLPVWLSDRSWHGMNARSTARAVARGLTLRPLVETLRDGLHWRESSGTSWHGAGLTDSEEGELLGEWLGQPR